MKMDLGCICFTPPEKLTLVGQEPGTKRAEVRGWRRRGQSLGNGKKPAGREPPPGKGKPPEARLRAAWLASCRLCGIPSRGLDFPIVLGCCLAPAVGALAALTGRRKAARARQGAPAPGPAAELRLRFLLSTQLPHLANNSTFCCDGQSLSRVVSGLRGCLMRRRGPSHAVG